MGVKIPDRQQKRDSVLVTRERVFAQGHEQRAAVRWHHKRAQVSRLVVPGRAQLE